MHTGETTPRQTRADDVDLTAVWDLASRTGRAVEPGAEYDAVCAELIEEIGKLENADTGAPAVREVVRTDTVYGSDRHPNVPDLVVRFDGSSRRRSAR